MLVSRLNRLWSTEDAVWNTLTVISFGLLVVLVVFPLGWLLIDSIRSPDGALTLANFQEVFSKPRYLRPIGNSLRVSASVVAGSLLVGIPMAWLVTRTNMPGRRAIRMVVYTSFIVPVFLGALSWVLLAGPGAGHLNKLAEALIGFRPFNIFTLDGLAFTMVTYFYTYTFILVANALDNVGAEVEEAAAILGAPWWKRAVTVTIPLAMPAILNAITLTFLQSLALFASPAMIALPAGKQVITTQLYAFYGYPPKPHLAAAYGVPLLVVAFGLLWLRRRLMGRRGYETIAGKGSSAPPLLELGLWRWPALAVCAGVIFVFTGLPLLTLIYTSFLSPWTAIGSALTLKNYAWVFNNAMPAVRNTLLFCAAAASGAALLALLVAYLNTRRPSPFHRFQEFLTTVPIVVPGILLAIGMMSAYSRPPIFIYGTAIILVVAFWGRFVPVAFENVGPSIRAIHPELEQASRNVGATVLGTVFRITLPLAKGGLLAGGLLTFILAAQEVSAAIMLVTLRTEIIPTLLLSLYDEAAFDRAAALGMVLIMIIFLAVIVGVSSVGTTFIRRRRG